MIADIRLARPEDAEFTLTMTMTLKEWRAIKDKLEERADGRFVSYPMSTLAHTIRNLIENANNRFQENLADIKE